MRFGLVRACASLLLIACQLQSEAGRSPAASLVPSESSAPESPESVATTSTAPNGRSAGHATAGFPRTIHFGPRSDKCDGEFLPGPALSEPRLGASAILLRDGTVLASGGLTHIDPTFGMITASAQRFDPQTLAWSPVTPMLTARAFHSMALLPDGKVLVAGGHVQWGSTSTSTNVVEIFDPHTSSWRLTAPTPTPAVQLLPLPDGTVLATHVIYVGDRFASRFDPFSETWVRTPMPIGTGARDAFLLRDGRVLLNEHGGAMKWDPVTGHMEPWNAGRFSFFQTRLGLRDGRLFLLRQSFAAVVDPLTDISAQVATPSLPREMASAVELATGEILVVGGFGSSLDGVSAEHAAQVYRPAEDAWSSPVFLQAPRYGAKVVALPDGRALLIGGIRDDVPLAQIELFVPGKQACARVCSPWRRAPNLPRPVSEAHAVTLSDGRILVTGSDVTANFLFDPLTERWSVTEPRRFDRQSYALLALPDDQALIAGGFRAGDGAEVLPAETFDSRLNQWLPAGDLNAGRWNGAAVLVGEDVFLVGRSKGASPGIEWWSLHTRRWSLVPAADHWTRIVKLDEERAIAFAAGYMESGGLTASTSSQIVHRDGLVEPGPTRVHRGNLPAVAMIAGGSFIVAEGHGPWPMGIAEVFDRKTLGWRATPSLQERRSWPFATGLDDGRALIVGGSDMGDDPVPEVPTDAEIYDADANAWTRIPGPYFDRLYGAALVPLKGGRALVIGGHGIVGRELESAEIFDRSQCPARLGGTLREPLH